VTTNADVLTIAFMSFCAGISCGVLVPIVFGLFAGRKRADTPDR
jgi:hypothetical protein